MIEAIPFGSTEMKVKYLKRGNSVSVTAATIEGEVITMTRDILKYATEAVSYIHGITKECPKSIALH